MKLKPSLVALCVILSQCAIAQEEDLLKGLDSTATTQKTESAFKSPRVIMSHSIQMLKPGVLDFRILHRFGAVDGGFEEFFGLDEATMRIGLDYGLTNNFTIGIGRSTFLKELDGYLKYRIVQQSTGKKTVPLSLAIAAGSTIRTGKSVDSIMKANSARRMGYYAQMLLGRKFGEGFTLQLSPILVHQNLVELKSDHNNVIAIGAGTRIRLSNRISLNADYYYITNPLAGRKNPLSIGFDIETGGHVFQLHFSNAEGMNERAFINDTYNDWSSVRFGFNLSRVFQVRKHAQTW